jgi:1-acyl-sn-glycerol-3-phosphate acyltransferase
VSTRSLERAHRRARERGVLAPLYSVVRFLVAGVLRVWFRVRISGAEHIPDAGAAIVAPNHKSFLDAFFVAIATRRTVRFMVKSELLRGPLGWLFLRLGAFPVRRGEADAEAMQTARLILEQGGLLVVFPEGTRVEDAHALGAPHHGAGRLALQTGAPLIPAAIAGTQRLWLGPIPKPRQVQLAFLPAIDPKQFSDQSNALGALVDSGLWPAVQREYRRELARPGLILAALAAIGLGSGLLARRRASADTRVIGVVEPLKLRRRKARRQLLERVQRRWRQLLAAAATLGASACQ